MHRQNLDVNTYKMKTYTVYFRLTVNSLNNGHFISQFTCPEIAILFEQFFFFFCSLKQRKWAFSQSKAFISALVEKNQQKEPLFCKPATHVLITE